MYDNLQQKTPATINILKEQVFVQKRIIEKASVHIERKVHHNGETIHIPVTSEEVEDKKISVDQYVETIPPVRFFY